MASFARAVKCAARNVGQIGAGRAVNFLPQAKQVWVTRPAAARANDKLVRVQVSGDSLIGDEIRDGDYIICRTNFDFIELRAGQIVVALLPSGELTLKKFYLNLNGTVTLRAANPLYPDQTFGTDEIEIHAVALELNRSL